jgi:hypothetical protein
MLGEATYVTQKLILFALLSAERSGVRFGAARRGACGPPGPACERGRPRVVGRGTPPELVLYGGAGVGYGWLVIVRERRVVTTLGVAVALVGQVWFIARCDPALFRGLCLLR